MPRIFVAVELSEEVRASLAEAKKALERTGADLKLVESENIHLTMRFIGGVSENKLEDIKWALKSAEKPEPFKALVYGMGVFPHPGYIRVVWAGVADGSEKLKSLRESLDSKLSEVGISSEDKDFTPHFTIARVKSGRAKDNLNDFVDDNLDREWGVIKVNKIDLMKSDLTPEGPVYTVLESFPIVSDTNSCIE